MKRARADDTMLSPANAKASKLESKVVTNIHEETYRGYNIRLLLAELTALTTLRHVSLPLLALVAEYTAPPFGVFLFGSLNLCESNEDDGASSREEKDAVSENNCVYYFSPSTSNENSLQAVVRKAIPTGSRDTWSDPLTTSTSPHTVDCRLQFESPAHLPWENEAPRYDHYAAVRIRDCVYVTCTDVDDMTDIMAMNTALFCYHICDGVWMRTPECDLAHLKAPECDLAHLKAPACDRIDHSLLRIDDSNFMMAGGSVSGGGMDCDSSSNVCTIYNVVSNTWRLATPMLSQRCRFAVSSVVVRGQRRLYVFGGARCTDEPIASSEFYSVDAGKWVRIEDMPRRRKSCVAVAIKDRIFVFGGDVPDDDTGGTTTSGPPLNLLVDEYDPVSDVWNVANWTLPLATKHFSWVTAHYDPETQLLFLFCTYENREIPEIYQRQFPFDELHEWIRIDSCPLDDLLASNYVSCL